jgi:hypothetical protein
VISALFINSRRVLQQNYKAFPGDSLNNVPATLVQVPTNHPLINGNPAPAVGVTVNTYDESFVSGVTGFDSLVSYVSQVFFQAKNGSEVAFNDATNPITVTIYNKSVATNRTVVYVSTNLN